MRTWGEWRENWAKRKSYIEMQETAGRCLGASGDVPTVSISGA